MSEDLSTFTVGFIDNNEQGDMAWLQLKCNNCNENLMKNTAWQWDSLASVTARANSHKCKAKIDTNG